MTELSLRFTSDHEKDPDGPIHVAVRDLAAGTYTDPQPFTPPLSDQQLGDLRWYLEVYSTWPTGPDYIRAERIESELETWGKALRRSVIFDEAAIRIWQQFVDSDGDLQVTIDATDPRVLRLPWELLADEGGHLFSQGVSVRRRLQKTQRTKLGTLALPVRILVVVARPDDAGFIDPRAITRPLLDAVAGLGEDVVVEFLDRPTLTALSQRLRDRKAPPVHVVHFDGHGVYDKVLGLGYLLFEKENFKSDRVDANRLGTLLNQTGVPLMVLNACQSAAQDDANPYASVAARLIRSGVGSVLAMNYAVLVVAAHKFVAAFYGSLAAGATVGRAVEAGRFALLADIDRHTLTRRSLKDDTVREETIRLYDWFLPALYQQADDPAIFPNDRAETIAALPTRQTYPLLVQQLATLFDAAELDDLCRKLGIEYANLTGDSRTAKMLTLVQLAEQQDAVAMVVAVARQARPLADWDTALQPSAAAQALASAHDDGQGGAQSRAVGDLPAALPAALPPPPRHGFHGRSREMLALQRAFGAYPIVVLYGFGGLGKTALATEAGRWFRRTGRFPGGAAFVSFEHGGSLDQLCSWVGQTISGDPDWVIHGEGDQVDRIGALLAKRPALLILDNFESVLGREPVMPAEELRQVLDAVWAWSSAADRGAEEQGGGQDVRGPVYAGSGGTRVLITTRDTNFGDGRFAPSQMCQHVGLQGLAQADALALAAAVLDDHGIDRGSIEREALTALLDRLGGHPLSLNLVLPHLREYTPEELTARFEELLPGFIKGEARERNESLTVSLEFSLRRLGEATRKALPDLAVFEGGALEVQLLEITQMDAELWQAARAELEQAALVTAESIAGVNPPFLRFHPTLLPYLATLLDDKRRAALETRYWQRYYVLANFLAQSDTQNPHQARAIALRELPNLRRALDLALAAGALDEAVAFADSIARFLEVFGRNRERDAMMKKVSDQWTVGSGQRESEIPNPQSAITKSEYLLLDRQGDTLLSQGRAAQAEGVFRDLLARLEAGAAYDAAYDIAMTQWRIGRCREAQGQPTDAIAWQRRALAGFAALSDENEAAKQQLGFVHADLADNQAAVGRFDDAEKNYKISLRIAEETDNLRSAGVALGQLGTLALARNDLAAAQTRYREALETFRALGEPQSEAVAWHQLGMVAQEARQWAEAERCYREAVRINERQKNLPGVARTCNQLAIVAANDGRPADAERWYLRAIEVNEQLGQQLEMAVMLSNLAGLLLGQGRLDEAAGYARRAVAIVETLDLSAEPWKTYAILAQIADKQGDAATARAWRRKAQETYAAYAGASHQLPSWAPPFINAVAAAVQGNAQARREVEQVLPQMLESTGWRNLPPVVERILDGETDGDSLTEGLDGIDAYIIRSILALLDGSAPPAPMQSPPQSNSEAAQPAASGQQQTGITLDQLVQLVGAACQPGAPAGLAEQMHALTRQLATNGQMPPEAQALGRILNAILSGERNPDLSALPEQLAQPVQALLAALA